MLMVKTVADSDDDGDGWRHDMCCNICTVSIALQLSLVFLTGICV